jgi:thiol-disulfide isomerase/thioredoxin
MDTEQRSPADNMKLFESGELLSKDGPVSARDALKGKYVGVYFSASWCPPCQRFTPKLVDAYTSNLKGKNLEIVFVSAGMIPFRFQSLSIAEHVISNIVALHLVRPRRSGVLLLLLQNAMARNRL